MFINWNLSSFWRQYESWWYLPQTFTAILWFVLHARAWWRFKKIEFADTNIRWWRQENHSPEKMIACVYIYIYIWWSIKYNVFCQKIITKYNIMCFVKKKNIYNVLLFWINKILIVFRRWSKSNHYILLHARHSSYHFGFIQYFCCKKKLFFSYMNQNMWVEAQIGLSLCI